MRRLSISVLASLRTSSQEVQSAELLHLMNTRGSPLSKPGHRHTDTHTHTHTHTHTLCLNGTKCKNSTLKRKKILKLSINNSLVRDVYESEVSMLAHIAGILKAANRNTSYTAN